MQHPAGPSARRRRRRRSQGRRMTYAAAGAASATVDAEIDRFHARQTRVIYRDWRRSADPYCPQPSFVVFELARRPRHHAAGAGGPARRPGARVGSRVASAEPITLPTHGRLLRSCPELYDGAPGGDRTRKTETETSARHDALLLSLFSAADRKRPDAAAAELQCNASL